MPKDLEPQFQSLLPPLTAIRAFEAAARHQSFTRAAAELGMTQAAVSYQVKLLEDRVGKPLFHRLTRRVELSDAGRRLAPAIAEAFETLHAAFAEMRERDDSVLAISAVHTFATNWLVPRLGGFQKSHPEIAVRIELSGRAVDFTREEFDIGLRGGRGVWPGLRSHQLIPITFTALCAPDFIERHGPFREPADLLRAPRLDAHDEWWRLWCQTAGIVQPPPPAPSNVSLDVQSLLGTAAIAGQGVAILMPAFFKADIAAGRLVQPFDLVATDGTSYWLVYPEARQGARKIRAFRDWILDEAQR
ncbi:MAG TPA: transcriptional regulator GcvA [Candidatus Binatia bacterium]|nr:transcriptional regulator GcvA [Candidatus Binatia bacterium]